MNWNVGKLSSATGKTGVSWVEIKKRRVGNESKKTTPVHFIFVLTAWSTWQNKKIPASVKRNFLLSWHIEKEKEQGGMSAVVHLRFLNHYIQTDNRPVTPLSCGIPPSGHGKRKVPINIKLLYRQSRHFSVPVHLLPCPTLSPLLQFAGPCRPQILCSQDSAQPAPSCTKKDQFSILDFLPVQNVLTKQKKTLQVIHP